MEKGEKKGEKRSYEIIMLKNGKISTSSKSELVGGEKGKLIPTDIGMVVNDFLMKYFPAIMDYNFTAHVENNFDEIAAGKEKWNDEIGRFYEGFHPNIEQVASMRLEHKVGERLLGIDPKSGKPVSVKIGRYGPLVQLGSTDAEEKPRFASLQKGQSVSTLTLDEALRLFELPRTLGTLDGEPVVVAVGKYGPYVKRGKSFVSVPADIAPLEITLEQAEQLFAEKQEADKQKVLKTFDEDPDILVLNGRYGPYISYKKKNYKIPRKQDASALSLADCRAIIESESNATKPATRRRARAKK